MRTAWACQPWTCNSFLEFTTSLLTISASFWDASTDDPVCSRSKQRLIHLAIPWQTPLSSLTFRIRTLWSPQQRKCSEKTERTDVSTKQNRTHTASKARTRIGRIPPIPVHVSLDRSMQVPVPQVIPVAEHEQNYRIWACRTVSKPDKEGRTKESKQRPIR